MSKLRMLGLLALLIVPMVSGCYVQEVRPPPPACRAVWERGHYDRAGIWIRGHWRCV
jgi:hypothetical protein